jgi:choline dehydrogenase-like flavoprotein
LIRNLADCGGRTNVTGKVCIIGAGIAGLLLAWRLRAHGMRVIVLESGHKENSEAADALNAATQLAQVYSGATLGRFRGLGGTSSKWGGQLIPMRPEDMAARPYVGIPAWPVQPKALIRYLTDITFKSYLRHFVLFWRNNGLENIAHLRLFSVPDKLDQSMLLSLRAGDVYHPAGSTRMGTNSREAVVDSDLRVFGLPNLWVASTSTFPSLGTANPTLTLMLLTLRLSEHLCKFL